MYDALGLLLGEHLLNRRSIRYVGVNVIVPFVVHEARQPRFLQIDVVIVIEIVQPYDLSTSVKKGHGNGGPNKAGCAGDEDFHCWYTVSVFSTLFARGLSALRHDAHNVVTFFSTNSRGRSTNVRIHYCAL